MAQEPEISAVCERRGRALSRWDNEGGAGAEGAQASVGRDAEHWDGAQMSNADLVQLRVRVIALENVVITLLAEASHAQLKTVREMAAFISPRPGFTAHPLTLHAARQMIHLVDRAGPFRS